VQILGPAGLGPLGPALPRFPCALQIAYVPPGPCSFAKGSFRSRWAIRGFFGLIRRVHAALAWWRTSARRRCRRLPWWRKLARGDLGDAVAQRAVRRELKRGAAVSLTGVGGASSLLVSMRLRPAFWMHLRGYSFQLPVCWSFVVRKWLDCLAMCTTIWDMVATQSAMQVLVSETDRRVAVGARPKCPSVRRVLSAGFTANMGALRQSSRAQAGQLHD